MPCQAVERTLFYDRFLDMHSGARVWRPELSTIDSGTGQRGQRSDPRCAAGLDLGSRATADRRLRAESRQ